MAKPGGRRKRIAVGVAIAAIAVLLAAGFAVKDRLVERWYLHRLETGTEEEMLLAAKELARRGCVDAVPAILRAMDRSAPPGHPLALLVGPASIRPGTSSVKIPPGFERLGFLKAIHDMMPAGTPHLLRSLTQEDAAVARWAATILSYSARSSAFGDWVHQGRFVSDVRQAIPIFEELEVSSESAEVRAAASAVLEKLGRGLFRDS